MLEAVFKEGSGGYLSAPKETGTVHLGMIPPMLIGSPDVGDIHLCLSGIGVTYYQSCLRSIGHKSNALVCRYL